MAVRFSQLRVEYDEIKTRGNALISSLSDGPSPVPFVDKDWFDIKEALSHVASRFHFLSEKTQKSERALMLKEDMSLLRLRLLVFGANAAFNWELSRLGSRFTPLLGKNDVPERESEFWDRWLQELAQERILLIAPLATMIYNATWVSKLAKGITRGMVVVFDGLLFMAMITVMQRTMAALETRKLTFLHEMRAKQLRTTDFVRRAIAWLTSWGAHANLAPASDEEILKEAAESVVDVIEKNNLMGQNADGSERVYGRHPTKKDRDRFIAIFKGEEEKGLLTDKQRVMLGLLLEMSFMADTDLAENVRGTRSVLLMQ